MKKKISHSIASVLQFLETKAPISCAESWDSVGLLVGNPNWETESAVVAIDLSEKALELALSSRSNLIITHHPCIFSKSKGLSRLIEGEESGTLSNLIFKCIENKIAVVSVHTNFDQCALEVNQQISKGLDINIQGRLFDDSKNLLYKLVTFVPQTHADRVRTALSSAGAGNIGQYDFCSFSMTGEGRFRGEQGTKPFLGKPGQVEVVTEERIETVFPKSLQSIVIKALFDSHPYQELAYDLYEVKQSLSDLGQFKGLGYGFWGEFFSTKSFSEVAQHVKDLFGVEGILMSGTSPKKVKKVAFAPGKGASFISHALSLECDLFITGEVGYHNALEAARQRMITFELGHTHSEVFFPKVIQTWLTELGVKARYLNLSFQRFLF